MPHEFILIHAVQTIGLLVSFVFFFKFMNKPQVCMCPPISSVLSILCWEPLIVKDTWDDELEYHQYDYQKHWNVS